MKTFKYFLILFIVLYMNMAQAKMINVMCKPSSQTDRDAFEMLFKAYGYEIPPPNQELVIGLRYDKDEAKSEVLFENGITALEGNKDSIYNPLLLEVNVAYCRDHRMPVFHKSGKRALEDKWSISKDKTTDKGDVWNVYVQRDRHDYKPEFDIRSKILCREITAEKSPAMSVSSHEGQGGVCELDGKQRD